DRALQLRARDLEAARVREAPGTAGGQQRERVGLAAVGIAYLRQVPDCTAAGLVLVDVVVAERDVGRWLVHVRDRDRELLVERERATVGRTEADRVRALRFEVEARGGLHLVVVDAADLERAVVGERPAAAAGVRERVR